MSQLSFRTGEPDEPDVGAAERRGPEGPEHVVGERPGFRVQPSSARPLALLAFATTRAGALLHRATGRYGFNALRRLTGRALASQTLLATSPDAVIGFPALDSYSCQMFLEAYEPEVADLLWLVRNEPFGFLDCGANLGFWAVLVSGPALGAHPCVAVEASGQTFRMLERNRARNDHRFHCLHAAVHDRTGQTLHLDESVAHPGRHLAGGATRGTPVRSVCIDDVVAEHLPEASTLVVKLDVEGSEPRAIAGASQTRRGRDCLFVVEDHGGDAEHRSAEACFAAGLTLWFLRPGARALPMPDLQAVAAAKRSPTVGYNFLAHAQDSPLAARLGLTPERARTGRPLQLSLARG